MTAYWFKPKRYGYGATPVTWQGWAVTLGTVLIMVVGSLVLRLTESSWGLAMLAFDAAALGVLFVVCRRRTDGEWRWRWRDR
ncbi:MAG: hypothetical protein WBD71_18625 [Xanthobacteraceae bacterium]